MVFTITYVDAGLETYSMQSVQLTARDAVNSRQSDIDTIRSFDR